MIRQGVIEFSYRVKSTGIVARANVAAITISLKQHPLTLHAQNRYFGALSPITNRWNSIGSIDPKAMARQEYIGSVLSSTISPSLTLVRTITKFSRKKGKRKTCKAVLKRFYRLNWGIWIRTRVGRHSKLWKKKETRKRRLRQHVFTNATQSFLLDKMVTKYWRRPHYYPEDPYNPYHTREEFPYSRKKPIP